MENINTLEQLQIALPDDKSARKYMAKKRWGDWACCPFCGNKKAYFIEEGKRYKCANKMCYKKFSVTSMTVIEATNLSLEKWIYAFFLFAKSRGRMGSIEMCNTISIAQKNEFFFKRKIRVYMALYR